MSKQASYPLKSSPVGADLVNIVDSEDDSQSPQGSTKRATLGSQWTAGYAYATSVAVATDPVFAGGADPTGGSDSTAAIQAALLSFGTLGGWSQGNGGVVYLPEGYYVTSKPLIIPSGVTLKGSGWGTQITLTTGSNCDIIQWATYDSSAQAAILGVSASGIANAFWAGIRDLALHGEAFSATTAAYHHGINVTTNPLTEAADGDPDFDPCPTVENVRVEACTGDGYYHAGRSGAFIKRMLVQYCNGNAYTPSFDTTLIDCLAEATLCGFYLNHGSNVSAGCKSYNNQDRTWVSGTSYSPGTTVVYSGALYFCILAVSGSTVPSSDTTHWTHLTAATSPQANGCGLYWDTNAGEHAWGAVDAQENSSHNYYVKGANTGPISINGTSSDPNFNNGQPAFSASNPHNYAHIALDGVSGSNVQLACNGTAADHMADVALLNNPGANTLLMTTDGNETTQFAGGAPLGFTVLNGVVMIGAATGTPLIVSADGTATSDGAFSVRPGFFGIYNAGVSNLYGVAGKLADVPSGAVAFAPYWGGFALSSSIPSSDAFPIFGVFGSDQDGSSYGVGETAFVVLANGAVFSYNNVLDDGSGNATFIGNLLVNNPSAYASASFVGIAGGAQYSNFQLADDVYPLDAAGHYWAFSHRTSEHDLLIYNYNGASYSDIFSLTEAGEVATGKNVLDDGSGNIALTGGIATAIRTVTTSPSLSTDSVVLLNGAALTATLPTAVGIAGRQYTVKLIASGTTGTVATTSSQTIDGSTTYSLSVQHKYVTVVSDGSNWQIIANN